MSDDLRNRVMEQARRQQNLRRTVHGPAVWSVSISELEAIFNAALDAASSAPVVSRPEAEAVSRASVEALADELQAEFDAYRLDDPVHLRVRALLAADPDAGEQP